MTMTALELITRSYYVSQIVSPELQTVSGAQINTGLYLLNALLDVKGSDIRLIPYFNQTVFNTVQAQEMYFIPNQLSVESLTFNIGTVRYKMEPQTRDNYFGSGRVDDIQSLPFTYRIERCLGGLNVYLYYVPQAIYVMKAWGKVALTDVNLNTDLSAVYDKYYIEYLRFALGEYLCIEFSENFPELAMKKYNEIRKKLMDISPPDLSTRSVSVLSTRGAFNWAKINISPAWSPG
jgi:hypothetical protein